MTKQEKNKFFAELAIEAGTADIGFVRQFCYAFGRMVLKRVRNNEKVTVPDFGSFFGANFKERVKYDVYSKQMIKMAPIKVMRFKPDYKVRHYINTK